jgi:hypothetical protein
MAPQPGSANSPGGRIHPCCQGISPAAASKFKVRVLAIKQISNFRLHQSVSVKTEVRFGKSASRS